MGNDLQMMFQNGMPSMGAMGLGQQMAVGQQMDQQKLQEQQLINQQRQLANDNSSVMNPLNQQFRQGEIAQQQAQLPGIQGQSQSLASQGAVDTATTHAKIVQRLSSLGNQVGVDGMQKLGRDGETASQVAQLLDAYPPYMHKQVAIEAMVKYGADPNSPMIQAIQQSKDEDVRKSLATVGSSMALASKDWLTKYAALVQQGANEKAVANIHADATKYAADRAADSRVQAAEKRASQMFDHMNMNQKMAYLSSRIANGDATDGEKAQYVDLDNRIKAQNAARTPTLPNDITGTRTQTEAVTSPGGFDLNPAPAPTTPQANDVGTMAKNAWGAYEPNKYQYRIGPNGKLQRAPLN